jgi:hypothetical protein
MTATRTQLRIVNVQVPASRETASSERLKAAGDQVWFTRFIAVRWSDGSGYPCGVVPRPVRSVVEPLSGPASEARINGYARA